LATTNEKIKISKITQGVWLHTSFYTYPNDKTVSSNGLIVETNGGLILIDSAWGELATVELLEKIDLEIGLPVNKAIITHSHYDRLAGVDYLESKGIDVYAHPLTQKLAIQNGMPVPNNALASLISLNSSINIDGLIVSYFGAAHAADNIFVWLPDSHLLFGGCAIRALSSKSLGNINEADLNSWAHVIEKINLEYKDIKIVIPGHGEIGDKNLINNTYELINNRD
jgi:metallo-beta-lactamase class B VIM